MSSPNNLPPTMRALVLDTVGEPLQLRNVPTPQPTPGTVVIKVLATGADASLRTILSGKHMFTFPTPMIPGSRSVGRVAASGPDTTSLKVGQLVMTEPFVRGRDNTDVEILWGVWEGPSPETKKFYKDNWSQGTYAEYCRAPLENTWALNEEVLCKDLGVTIPEMTYFASQLVPYAGLRTIGLTAGETLIVAPATGNFSGGAIGPALAMGANVIATGRDINKLLKMKKVFPRINVIELTGDVQKDTAAIISVYGKPADAYIDVSPPASNGSTHVRACFKAVKQYGRVSLMGVISDDIAIPYADAVLRNLTIRGQYMYTQADVKAYIKLVESGALKVGKEAGVEVVGTFGLEEINRAFEISDENRDHGKMTALLPSGPL
ncbi:isopropanol dehydrogenase [Patellaria atrata CBS 101060]|uniref:Isopropanol dehydrogenase n=1 Tax=Patellaria atrata CBS 101060 TaxID=1346257 RepID=A0A9P4S2U8_9PEZI|nr:isopropanol dehydrogenase [Patellaria atrata CBS 101060]